MRTGLDRGGRGSRGAPRERAIVAATLELLTDRGYHRLTMDAIAERAHASKHTIYRRWPGKAALVVHAVRSHVDADEIEIRPTGDLRADLLALMRGFRARLRNNRDLVVGLIGAGEHDRELGSLLRAEVAPDKLRIGNLIVGIAEAAGETPPAARVVWEVGPSNLVARVMLSGEPVDDEYLVQLVDEVMVPLLTRKNSSGRNT